MYRIIWKNQLVGTCDTPNYIKKKKNVWINCMKEDAEGIAFNSIAYEGAIALNADAGRFIFDNVGQIQDTRSILNDELDATCQLSEDIEQRIADIEDVLCELTKEV